MRKIDDKEAVELYAKMYALTVINLFGLMIKLFLLFPLIGVIAGFILKWNYSYWSWVFIGVLTVVIDYLGGQLLQLPSKLKKGAS